MPKYNVIIPYPVWVTVEVEADSPEEAEDEAVEHGSLTAYCGNGGTDKLIGVSDSRNSIEAGECPLDVDGFRPAVEEVEP